MKRPIIGVFINNGVIRKLNNQNYNLTSYFRLEMLANESIKAGTTLYFFSALDVNLKNSTIRGTYFNEYEGIWKKKKFPLPDILYDRSGGFLKSQRRKVKSIRRKFSKLGIKKVNSQGHFNKWRTYEVLKKVPELQPHLPQTKRCKDLIDLRSFMKNKEKIYIKGINGSRGRKIIRLKKNKDGSFELKYFINQLVVKHVQSLDDVYKFLRTFFKGKQFIIQQAIPLMSINNRLVDFRAEVQRNKSGDLEVVGVSVRFGMQNSPITIHSKAYSFGEFFDKFFNYSVDEIIRKRNNVDSFLKKVYENVEANFGSFGEIGIDFGMDDQGGLWFIECNAKSAKVSLHKAYDEETVKKAFLNPLEYGKFIYQNN
ncbi:YheC/YheD family protein [Halalkalibacter flavus]|uniref:YheC/YheD family endospore coat-associated protein n=1 Tax=Halalkalibacter flavus TaxID=3090668 RepID=UPI002FC70871